MISPVHNNSKQDIINHCTIRPFSLFESTNQCILDTMLWSVKTNNLHKYCIPQSLHIDQIFFNRFYTPFITHNRLQSLIYKSWHSDYYFSETSHKLTLSLLGMAHEWYVLCSAMAIDNQLHNHRTWATVYLFSIGCMVISSFNCLSSYNCSFSSYNWHLLFKSWHLCGWSMCKALEVTILKEVCKP